MAKARVPSARKTTNAMSNNSVPQKRQRDDDDNVQAADLESDNNTPVSRPRGHKRSRRVYIDVDAENEDTVSNTTETIGDAVEEGEDDKLIHENTEESKKAWENRLAKMRKKWTASAYDHFLPDVEVAWNTRTKRWQQVFHCKFDPKVKIHRAFHDNSTPNIVRHARSCKAAVSEDDDEPKLVQSNLTSFVQGSTYTAACLRVKHVRMSARHHVPHAFVEWEEYRDILRMFNKDMKIFSADTLSRDIKDVYNLVKLRVAKLLQGVRGRIHVAQDGWAAPQKLSLLGLVVVWVADAKVQVMTMDMIHLKKSHTGANLAEMIGKSLREFGVVDKLLSLPGDNASSNVTMARSLKTTGKLPSNHIAGPTTHILCAGHIFDLANKAIFRYFIKKAKVTNRSFLQDDDDSWLEDDEDDDLDAEEQDLLDELTSDAREANEDATLEDLLEAVDNLEALEEEDGNLGRNAVMKIFKLGRRIFNNGAMQHDLREECANNGIRINDMIRAVITRWLTHGTVLRRALELRPALDSFCELSKWNDKNNPKKSVRRFKLNATEWEFIVQLKLILTMLAAATITLSKSGVPLIHHVLPMFDDMIDKLDKIIMNENLFPGVRAAAIRACQVLCKYYSKTDDSYMYRMAMIMHPAYKMEYFREQKWEPEWIERCFEIVRDIWQKHYKPVPSPADVENQSTNDGEDDDMLSDYFKKRRRNSDGDALEKYLRDPVLEDLDDPLHYWSSLLDPCDQSGKVSKVTSKGALAQMALDFLSAPAMSTDVERLFSHGGLNVMKRRHNLSAESTIDQTVLNSWIKHPGLVDNNKLTEFFSNKSKRPNNGGKKQTMED